MWVWIDDVTGQHAPLGRRSKPLPPRVEGDTAFIQLTRGYFAAVDVDDAPLVADYLWTVFVPKDRKALYAFGLVNGKNVRMHRLILPPKKGFHIDHIDGDGLNNRRSNLRYSTNSQNTVNQRLLPTSTTGFRGVRLEKRYDPLRWKAEFNIEPGRKKHLGTYTSPEEAARAYDAAAREHYGEFARLNFPEPGERGCR